MAALDYSKFSAPPPEEDYHVALRVFSRDENDVKKIKQEKHEEAQRQNAKKSLTQLKREQKQAFMLSSQVLITFGICLACIAIALNLHVKYNELTRELQQCEKTLSTEQSETISLNASLSSELSLVNLDEYAVKHGFTLQRAQTIYIDSSEYKQNKTTEKEVENND